MASEEQTLIERGRAAGLARMEGLTPYLWPTAQTAIAAGLSWELARRVLDHPRPIFAPIIAIVAMGFTAGRRGRQAIVLVLGVTLGIGIADMLVRVLGNGGIGVTVAVFVAMSIALVVSREPLFVVQAGISALLLIAVDREGGGIAPDRLEDALVGGVVALVLAAVVFPLDPVEEVKRGAEPILARIAESLRGAAAALRDDDIERAEQARSIELDHRAFAEAVALGLEATRVAPRRRRDRDRVWDFVVAARHLEVVARAGRTIAGAARRIVREGGAPRPDVAGVLGGLADATELLATWLEAGTDETLAAARARAAESAAAAATIPADIGIGVGTIVHLAQVIGIELLRAGGLDATQAQEAIVRAADDAA